MPLLLKTLQQHRIATRIKCKHLTSCSQCIRISCLSFRPSCHSPISCAPATQVFPLFLDYFAPGPSNWPGMSFLNIVTWLTASYRADMCLNVISSNRFDLPVYSCFPVILYHIVLFYFHHSTTHHMTLFICLFIEFSHDKHYNVRNSLLLNTAFSEPGSRCLINVSRLKKRAGRERDGGRKKEKRKKERKEGRVRGKQASKEERKEGRREGRWQSRFPHYIVVSKLLCLVDLSLLKSLPISSRPVTFMRNIPRGPPCFPQIHK